MDDGEASSRYTLDAGRNMKQTPTILEQVVTEYLNSDIEVLLIPGDMTKNGEKQSHIDFVEKLRPLLNKGVRIFVIPGNHDVNIPQSVEYKGTEVLPVENVSASEFEKIYNECGYSSAIKRDTASLSYVASLSEDIWLLAIDGCKYEEHKNTSISSGRIKEETEAWIVTTLNEAKKQNKTIISMMHHGLAEHLVFQDMFFPQYLIDDWQRLAGLFADNGIKAIFTGHFHANDIVEFISDNNNGIYDIETGSLATYPYPYRFAELSNKGIDITTKNVFSIPQNPNLYENGKAELKEWALEFAKGKMKGKMPEISDDLMLQIADVASDVIMLHVKGDEVVNDELKDKITTLARAMDAPIYLTPENIQIDTPPTDNNVYLLFR